MDITADIPDEHSSSPSSDDTGGIYGDPQVVPRVGPEYQAEIPSFISGDDKVQAGIQPNDSEIKANQPNRFSLGLPIPLMWAYCEVENTSGTLEFENLEENHMTSNRKDAKPEVEAPDTGKYQMDVVLALPYQSKAKYIQAERHICPLPGSLGNSLSEVEQESFLLGLYIFGKNLDLVKRLVETKGMGDILSFYYGEFFRSNKYRRWLECRQFKSKRFVQGQKIFSGWRQQELFSRIFPRVSEECQKMLTEDLKKFTDGSITFEEYIFTLKSRIGISLLIEAIAIGKGKQDLTGNALEPVKSNHVSSIHSEIPVGKACSALSSTDIIRFLTGDFRLSKARSSDLFWEAVWPRLLARGWHSEQPDSRNSLVFLIPGIKKFSRRRLVKGDHYFDSVSDVLHKVASEPELLELEPEPESMKVEDKSREMLDEQPQRYLQPRKSGDNRRGVRVTIVDTSLLDKRHKLREVRRLPLEIAGICTLYTDSSESERDALGDSRDNEDELTNTSVSTIMTVENHEKPNVKRQKKPKKYQPNRNSTADHFNCLAHVTENLCMDRKIDETESKSNSPNACGDSFQPSKIQCSSPTSYSAKGSEDRNINKNYPRNEMSSENDGLLTADTVRTNDQSSEKLIETSQKHEQIKPADAKASMDDQPSMNNRRHSTRNRPLTTKALEALQFGLLSPKRSRKNSDASQRRVRHKPAVTDALNNSIENTVVDSRVEDGTVNASDIKLT